MAVMKIKLLLGIACCAAVPLVAHGQRLATAVEQEAAKYSRAVVANDYEKVLSYTHERVIDTMGRKEAATVRAHEKGAPRGNESQRLRHIEDTKVGLAPDPQKIGPWTITVVPETLTLRMPGARAQQESFLLAISADEGKSWKFIDLGPLSEDQLFRIFPELKGQFRMPPKKPAVPEKSP